MLLNIKKKFGITLIHLSKHRFFQMIFYIIDRVRTYKIDEASAVIGFWITASLFPFAIFILYSFNFFHLNVIEALANDDNLPETFKQFFTYLLKNTKLSFLSWNLIFILFSSAKILEPLLRELSVIFEKNIKIKFIERLKSLFFLFLFVVIILFVLIFNVTVSYLVDALKGSTIFDLTFISRLIKFFAFPLIIFIFISSIFYYSIGVDTRKKTRLKASALGSIIFVISWTVFINLFAFYSTYLSNMSQLYGIMSYILSLLLMAYFTSYLLLLSAVISKYYLRCKNPGDNVQYEIIKKIKDLVINHE